MARPRTRDPDANSGAVLLRRLRGDGLFAGALALFAFLLLCWPFVRTPPMDAGHALVFVLVGWAGFIVAVAALMAGGARRRRRGGSD
jgi:hypothetical protein